MKKSLPGSLVPAYLAVLIGALILMIGGNRAVTVLAESAPLKDRTCFIIDAGHGGEDGGATSCTGVLESTINLEIALRLNDLLHLLGYDTYMIRTSDISIYTQGTTIAQKKVSDLKERVRIANTTENAVLVSIHQNHYPDSRYSGAQVFYNANDDSKDLASTLQSRIISTLNPGSRRQCKKSSGIYLMDHIQCPGILIECGFLSHIEEEGRLRDPGYQKDLSCVIAVTLAEYANT